MQEKSDERTGNTVELFDALVGQFSRNRGDARILPPGVIARRLWTRNLIQGPLRSSRLAGQKNSSRHSHVCMEYRP
jgi:hypothetical protein